MATSPPFPPRFSSSGLQPQSLQISPYISNPNHKPTPLFQKFYSNHIPNNSTLPFSLHSGWPPLHCSSSIHTHSPKPLNPPSQNSHTFISAPSLLIPPISTLFDSTNSPKNLHLEVLIPWGIIQGNPVLNLIAIRLGLNLSLWSHFLLGFLPNRYWKPLRHWGSQQWWRWCWGCSWCTIPIPHWRHPEAGWAGGHFLRVPRRPPGVIGRHQVGVYLIQRRISGLRLSVVVGFMLGQQWGLELGQVLVFSWSWWGLRPLCWFLGSFRIGPRAFLPPPIKLLFSNFRYGGSNFFFS